MVAFGQVVVGPPGSGKSTYCAGMSQLLTSLGRKCAVVNVDPANDELPYDPAVTIVELVSHSRVVEEHGLGPNGGLVYCMEYLEANFDWLLRKLEPLKGRYLLFDFPGQVELYTHQDSVKNMVHRLQENGYQLAMVNLVDAHHCTDGAKFISVLTSCLTVMIQLELPAVNVLSKVDLVEQFGQLDFNLDFYTEVMDLGYLSDRLSETSGLRKHAKLTKALCELIEDFSLVNFQTLDIQDKDSCLRVLKVVDKANGYMYGDRDAFKSYGGPVIGPAVEQDSRWTRQVQEKYVDGADHP